MPNEVVTKWDLLDMVTMAHPDRTVTIDKE